MNDQKNRDMVRSSDRHDTRLPARLQVAEHHEDEIKFSDGLIDQDGWLGVTLCNLSSGGLGIEASVFLPRGAVFRLRCDVRVGAHGEISQSGPVAGASNAGVSSTTLDINGLVRRVTMADPTPRYEVGMSFQDLPEQMRTRIDAFLGLMDVSCPVKPGETGGSP